MPSKNFNMSFDPEMRQQFSDVVAGYGLTVPQAFKLFANQAIHTGVLPLSFDWQATTIGKTPNLETQQAMREARADFEADRLERFTSVDEALSAMQESVDD